METEFYSGLQYEKECVNSFPPDSHGFCVAGICTTCRVLRTGDSSERDHVGLDVVQV